jgi:hypothetical protein
MTEMPESEGKSKWIKVGEVSVDSGTLLLSDPAYVIEGDMRQLPTYEEIVGLKQSRSVIPTKMIERRGGGAAAGPFRDLPAENAHVMQIFTDGTSWGESQPTAVVTRTGDGDGVYPVYAKIENDKVAEVRVVFLEEGEYASVARDYLTPTAQQIQDMLKREVSDGDKTK